MPPRTPVSPAAGAKRRPKGLLIRAPSETDLHRKNSAADLSRYGGSDAVPELPETNFLRHRLGSNLGFFLTNVGMFLERYQTQMHELSKPGGIIALARQKLDEHPRHPVGRVIRLKVQVDDDETEEAEDVEGAAAAAAEEPKSTKSDKSTGSKKSAAATEDGDGEDAEEIELGDDDDSDASSEAPEPSDDAPELNIPDNTELILQLELLKKEAYELGTTIEGIHDWVAFNIPILQEGIADETGLTVMSVVMEKASSLNEAIQMAYGLELSYLEGRTSLEIKADKYRDSPGALLQIISLDRGTWNGVMDSWRTLSRAAILLYADVQKNFARLRKPLEQSDIAMGGAYA